MTLRQEQFQTVAGIEGAASRRWSIPLQLRQRRRRAGCARAAAGTVGNAASPGCDGALLVDAGNVGFYRVRYAPPLFAALLARVARACRMRRA